MKNNSVTYVLQLYSLVLNSFYDFPPYDDLELPHISIPIMRY